MVREWTGRRGRGRERGLTAKPAEADADAVTVALLRPALEYAWAVARVGEDSAPTVPAPKALRPFLRFARLPDRALGVARRVLDEDDEFRARVLDAIDEEKVGAAGMLFLSRPEGWQSDIEALRDVAVGEDSASREEAEERTARRRLRGAEEAARRAEGSLAELRAEMTRVQDELTTERKARRALDEQLAAAQAAEAKARAEAGSSKAAADRARREKVELADELEALEARHAEVSAAAAPTIEEVAEPVEPGPLLAPTSADSADGSTDAPTTPPAPPAPATVAPTPADSGPMLERVGRAVAEAATAAAQLGAALAAASEALAPSLGAGKPDTTPEPTASTTSEPLGRQRRAPGPPAGPRRTPAPLPPAVFDDSVEAAEHLVRINGVIVLVDGYNVSKTRWPVLAINEQRQRLTNALGRLAARTGADIHAVFDGSEQPDVPQPTGPRRLVRVSFSPPTVEADDTILELVETIPRHRPVVVASSDRRVKDGARSRGANVISANQLLDLLDR